jgi:hypothetical protein
MFILLILCVFAHALPRVDIEHFIKRPELFNASKPFVITNAMQFPKHIHTKKWLKKSFGTNIADFFKNNLDKQGSGLFLYEFERALEELHSPQYLHLQLAPKDWAKLELTIHPWFIRDHWMKWLTPKQLEEFYLKTHWKAMLIGTPGAGMFRHKDGLRTSSWHLHIKGKKQWTICKDDTCTVDILKPGDVLFYPKDYYHETKCLSNPTITITDTVKTLENEKALTAKLRQQCTSPNREFDFSASLCDTLEQALRWEIPWRNSSLLQTIEMRANPDSLGNNYDGRNYITR